MHVPSNIMSCVCTFVDNKSRKSRGLSSMELIGILVAIGTGIWLGAMYIGFDLREAWNYGAQKTGLTSFQMEIPETVEDPGSENIPAEDELSRNKTDAFESEVLSTQGTETMIEGETTGNHSSQKSIPKGASSPHHHHGQLKTSTSTGTRVELPESGDGGQTPEAKGTNQANQKGTVGSRTLAYWNKLNGIMAKEEQMRSVPSGGLTSANASAFLVSRGKAAQYAANAIRRLPTSGVDPDVCRQAQTIAQWYSQGAELSHRAIQLLESGSRSLRQGAEGKKWKADEHQHLDELNLINHRSDILRGQMSDRYGLPFPDLR
ncbi:MAG: hypothetical protein JW829_18765 [Pirellulales bacterium]|nr:hypothetical protein [Pirellulales bacterium]